MSKMIELREISILQVKRGRQVVHSQQCVRRWNRQLLNPYHQSLTRDHRASDDGRRAEGRRRALEVSQHLKFSFSAQGVRRGMVIGALIWMSENNLGVGEFMMMRPRTAIMTRDFC